MNSHESDDSKCQHGLGRARTMFGGALNFCIQTSKNPLFIRTDLPTTQIFCSERILRNGCMDFDLRRLESPSLMSR